MDIITNQTYRVDGQEFRNLPDVKAHIEGQLGLILDNVNPRLPPKQALQLLEIIIHDRHRLIELLEASYQPDDQNLHGVAVSIFNL